MKPSIDITDCVHIPGSTGACRSHVEVCVVSLSSAMDVLYCTYIQYLYLIDHHF